MIIYFALSLAIIVLVITILLYYNFKPEKISKQISIVIISVWFIIFYSVVIISFDIYSTVTNIDNEIENISKVKLYVKSYWEITYWYLFLLANIILPIFQEFYIAADFTFENKFKRAVARNLIFYAIIGAIALIFLVYLFIIEKFTYEGIKTLVIALSNTWGSILIIFLLGYGLIEVPRFMLNMTNYNERMRYLEWKVSYNSEQINERKKELLICLKQLEDQREESQRLISPKNIYEGNNSSELFDDEKLNFLINSSEEELNKQLSTYQTKFNYENLIDICYLIKSNIIEISKLNHNITYIYSEWYKLNVLFGDLDSEKVSAMNKDDKALSDTISELGIFGKPTLKISNIKEKIREKDESFLSSANNKHKKSKSQKINEDGEVKQLLEESTREGNLLTKIVILYNRYFYQLFFRVLAFKCIAISIFVIVSELNVYFSDRNYMIKDLELKSQTFAVITFICLIPTIYMFLCTVFGLFNMEIYSYYGIYSGNGTDHYSLIFLTSFLCRIIFPLCLNVMNVLDIKNTSLQVKMNVEKIIPVLGNFYIKLFPTLLIIFCVINYFDFAGKFLKTFGLNYVIYDEYFTDLNKVSEGRKLLIEIKEEIQEGLEN